MMCIYCILIKEVSEMDVIKILNDNEDNFNISEIFNTDNEPDWVWVNRLIFIDILYNLGFTTDDELQEVNGLEDYNEEEIFSILEKIFKKHSYLRVDQNLFSVWEKDYKPTRDIETIIFVKNELYKKISIYCQNTYGWFLKAMAIDTYYKISSEFGSVKECYEELYEDNYRIIEDILCLNNYKYVLGCWEYVPKDGVLLFFKDEKFMNSWTEQEAESFYNELCLSDR